MRNLLRFLRAGGEIGTPQKRCLSVGRRYECLLQEAPNCGQQAAPTNPPAPAQATAVPPANPSVLATPIPLTGRIYTVAAGDTLGLIARKFDTTVQAIFPVQKEVAERHAAPELGHGNAARFQGGQTRGQVREAHANQTALDAQLETTMITIPDLRETANKLVAMANEAGGHDNISVILVSCEE